MNRLTAILLPYLRSALCASPFPSDLRLHTAADAQRFAASNSTPVTKREVYLTLSSADEIRAVLERVRGVETLSVDTDCFDWSLLQADGLAGEQLFFESVGDMQHRVIHRCDQTCTSSFCTSLRRQGQQNASQRRRSASACTSIPDGGPLQLPFGFHPRSHPQ